VAVGIWLRRCWSEKDVEGRIDEGWMRFPMRNVFENEFAGDWRCWLALGVVYGSDEAKIG